MKGWRQVLTYTFLAIGAAVVLVAVSILGYQFRKWLSYDEERVQAQIERRVRTLEERIEKLERR